MLPVTLSFLALSTFFYVSLGVLLGRDIDAPPQESYDYVIVGCGISGLVVTNRLSEDPSVTVLCIEAGIADHYEDIVQDPVYVGADIGGIYDWRLSTVPQNQLDGAARPMPQGKVLGGGSILNAMCWNRGGRDDYDAWEALGNPGWGWDGLLPYFKKAIYSEEIARNFSINYNPDVHGFSGPVAVSYPKYFYSQSINFFTALNLLGVPTAFDPNEGLTAGAAFVPTDIDPKNQTRADARRSYFDPYATRENFHVITGQQVTQILIEGKKGDGAASNPTSGGNVNGEGPAAGNTGGFGFGPAGGPPPTPPGEQASAGIVRRDPTTSNLRVTGVEFTPNATALRRRVYATREVIVAAGALHSAQLLQLSGIGPASILEKFNITVSLDLPGVGNNLQDHCLVGTFYPYNNASYPSPSLLTTSATYNAQAGAEYNNNKTGPWTAGSPNGLAFPPLPLITKNSAAILNGASKQAPTDHLVPGLDSTLIAGFSAQKASLVERLGTNTSAAYEIINNNAGSLTVAVMHPLSRGTCYINSPDPFEPPLIDPRWLSNPVDRQILIEALLFNRKILATPTMLELQPAQFVPPIEANEDALSQVINNGIRTEFHPSGTCAMLPIAQGGVVDPHLRVWGTKNLRVIDAGIFPMVPAAHLQAVVYGVAEKAADIIKADNIGVWPTPINSMSSSNVTVSASTTSIVGAVNSSTTYTFPSIITPSSLSGSSVLSSTSSTQANTSYETTTSSETALVPSRTAVGSNTTMTFSPLTTELESTLAIVSSSDTSAANASALTSSLSSDAAAATQTNPPLISSLIGTADSSAASSTIQTITNPSNPAPTMASLGTTITTTLSGSEVVSSSEQPNLTTAVMSVVHFPPSSSIISIMSRSEPDTTSIAATATPPSSSEAISQAQKSDISGPLTSSPPASPTVDKAAALSSSVMAALESGGVPSAVAAVLEPIIVGTQQAELSPKQQKALNAFIQWFSHVFHRG